MPVSKPGLPSFCRRGAAAAGGLIVQLNVALTRGPPVASLAVTVTVKVPAVVGVPEIRPVEELIDRPAGSPVAL